MRLCFYQASACCFKAFIAEEQTEFSLLGREQPMRTTKRCDLQGCEGDILSCT